MRWLRVAAGRRALHAFADSGASVFAARISANGVRCAHAQACVRRAGKEKPGNLAIAGFEKSGAPGRIRTSDPQVRSLVLYPAELRAPKAKNYAV